MLTNEKTDSDKLLSYQDLLLESISQQKMAYRPARLRPAEEPCYFMKMAPEVRTMIYECCLVVGKIFPYNHRAKAEDEANKAQVVRGVQRLSAFEEADNYEKPTTALLQVSSSIYNEAAPIMFEKNTVVLPKASLSVGFFSKAFHTPERKLWLKSLELKLSWADMSHTEKSEIADRHLSKIRNTLLRPPYTHDENFLSDEYAAKGLSYHDDCRCGISRLWSCKVEEFLEETYLKKLNVNFSDTYCPLGCCKMDLAALMAFSRGFEKEPEAIELIGVSPQGHETPEEESAARKTRRMTRQIKRWSRYRRRGGNGDLEWFGGALEEEEEICGWF
ncbi:hypothetical protein MMC28_010840 [Mycoblastus sanguinarius]|nr:hypothetical protein [Mycoblastus sanguinarius]